ncbi:hypothetical protein OEA41_003657 [Lepraria neglecta]|uniref:FAD-binding domain-containing protein n=1 Tax=Lepraria neglecta TaxID=209136 RepID=A0AAD9Z686_9LECA|nr:hypothetical protein OEA41_003657 [Lepraria neglecta]
MAIHWSLDRLEKLLPPELWAKLAETSCNPSVPMEAGGNYPIINGETGAMLAGVPYAKGLRVPRSKMRALCAEGIDVQYGKDLSDIAFNESGNGVIVTFSDGTIIPASIVLGADGPRSKVREFAMSGADKASVSKFPIWHHNMTVCYGDADKASQVSSLFYPLHLYLSGQRGALPTLKSRNYSLKPSKSLVSSMPDGPNHPETWVFHLAMAWLGNPDHSLSYKERLAMIKERAEELGEPARSAFTWIPPDTPVHKADISYWITQPWDNHGGRMTLVGDAAHPMPPYRGQGLNHCICDVSHVLSALDSILTNKSTLSSAITAYDEEIVPRGGEEVKCSVENGFMLHDWQKVLESPVFRNGFKPMTGHDDAEAKKVEERVVSEHGEVQMKREEEAVGKIDIAAH